MFFRRIQTATEINATPEQVWEILVDLDAYPSWNPMLSDVQTTLEVGAPIRFKVARPGGGKLRLRAIITRYDEARSLVWQGGNKLILSGEHYFRLSELRDGCCRLEHGETFRGLLMPFVKPFLKNGERVYQAMNEALRLRVENSLADKEL